jgi:hypothetical protein
MQKKQRSAAVMLDVNAAAVPKVRGHQAVQRFLLEQFIGLGGSGAGDASGR